DKLGVRAWRRTRQSRFDDCPIRIRIGRPSLRRTAHKPVPPVRSPVLVALRVTAFAHGYTFDDVFAAFDEILTVLTSPCLSGSVSDPKAIEITEYRTN